MADITMCKGSGCPLKEHCYRFTAPRNPYRQSFFVVVPLKKDEHDQPVCEYYSPID